LCSANGGFLTKHALGLYSTEPPANGFRWASVQAEVDALPAREVVEEHDGKVTVEAYTVMHSRDGEPENGLAAVLRPDGRRAWATTTEGSALRTMLDEEVVGRAAHLAADGTLSL
jgi:acetyl-CoA C-acetyltransferase